MTYADFVSILVLDDNGKQNQMTLILTDIKNIMLVAMVIN